MLQLAHVSSKPTIGIVRLYTVYRESATQARLVLFLTLRNRERRNKGVFLYLSQEVRYD